MNPTRAVITFGVLVALVSTAAATPIVKRGHFRGDAATLPCTVRVDFGSFAGGPDYDTFNTMRNYIADSKLIINADAWSWGKEGEFSLCLEVEDIDTQTKVVADLTALAPKVPAGKAGPTSVHTGKIYPRP
jgi:hypothetical protein